MCVSVCVNVRGESEESIRGCVEEGEGGVCIYVRVCVEGCVSVFVCVSVYLLHMCVCVYVYICLPIRYNHSHYYHLYHHHHHHYDLLGRVCGSVQCG